MTRTRITCISGKRHGVGGAKPLQKIIMTLTMMACVMFASLLPSSHSFVPTSELTTRPNIANRMRQNFPFAPATMRNTCTQLYAEALQDVESMKAGELRKELESYGISCKSFFEKKELVDALTKARAEGKTPINGAGANGASASSSASSETSSTGGDSANGDDGESRAEKIKIEMEKCKSMKVGDLKKELESLGVSTKSFFEKTEFVKALAEARVDGVKKRGAGAGAGQGFGRGQQQEPDEPHDPSYRDVVMQKMSGDARDPRMRGPLIDIQLGR
mmetsp:Transcript_9797/g.16253  ORF Transcript_9797/g.16253 Transcript_9797/m.16253 type:complete len:275 (-) Transcript_9797:191-1015(-)